MCRIIISGYFCTGKTSVIKLLEEEFNLHKPKVYTTRNMRHNEREGYPYTFIDDTQFQRLESINELFDPIKHAGNCYAADRSDIFDKAKWIIDILPDSWETYKQIPGVIGIYLIPPPKEELRVRALKRGDFEVSIEARLEAIHDQDLSSYHYVIEPQPSLEALCNKVRAIVRERISSPLY